MIFYWSGRSDWLEWCHDIHFLCIPNSIDRIEVFYHTYARTEADAAAKTPQ